MTVTNNEDPADPSTHHPGCPTPGGCSEHGCHGACLPDDEPTCDRCGAPITTGAMAAICPRRDQCAFWPEDEESQKFLDGLGMRVQPNTNGNRPAGQQRVKYLLCPGNVQSKTDRQYHYVGARDLAKLYGVRMDECEVRPERAFSRFGWRPKPGLVELHPRWDGDYRLPNTGAER